MTVREMIEKLKNFPQDAEVIKVSTLYDEDGEEYTEEIEVDFLYLTSDEKRVFI